ncbi:MAG: ferritin family protein [Candidatus Omnitrophica bacterium]|nr:ferritin family protein [Candidatus Omnitrophota bacterium]
MKITKTEGKIDIVDFNPWVAFEIACNIEQHGEKFYGHFAEIIEDKGTKDIMETLKKAEVKHYETFKNMQKNIPKPENIDEDNIYQMMNFGVFEGRYDWTLFKKVKDVIEFGIYIEIKSIELFSFYQKMIKDEHTKIILEKITGEERKHKSILEEILKTKFYGVYGE